MFSSLKNIIRLAKELCIYLGVWFWFINLLFIFHRDFLWALYYTIIRKNCFLSPTRYDGLTDKCLSPHSSLSGMPGQGRHCWNRAKCIPDVSDSYNHSLSALYISIKRIWWQICSEIPSKQRQSEPGRFAPEKTYHIYRYNKTTIACKESFIWWRRF